MSVISLSMNKLQPELSCEFGHNIIIICQRNMLLYWKMANVQELILSCVVGFTIKGSR